MTCATDGRAEHGTTRTSPRDSPLTVSNGWEYYKNLNESDFKKNFNIEDMFSVFEFSVNAESKDLYFFGVKS